MDIQDRLEARIREVTNWRVVPKPQIHTDTSDWMRIQRGHVVHVGNNNFVVEGNQYESRFGIGDQPKYWVFNAIDLETGRRKILKAVFHEEFDVYIGALKIHCSRSPQKEAQILDIVKGDQLFMQGFTELDDKGNRVRIIDFIKGPSILEYIYSIEKDHEQYFREDLPAILWKLTSCIQAIQRLHDQGTCHGDIRNDHILIDTDTKEYRWIDFDLHQHVSDFDVWSVGNILGYIVGKGINSFHQTLRSDEFADSVKHSLTSADASAFYEYRVINLRKLYPYIPGRLNDILMRFSAKTKRPYSTIAHLLEDYREMLEANFDSGRGPTKNGLSASTVARQRDENP